MDPFYSHPPPLPMKLHPAKVLELARPRLLALLPKKMMMYSSSRSNFHSSPLYPKRYRRLEGLRIPVLIRMARKASESEVETPEQLKKWFIHPISLVIISRPLSYPYQRKPSPLKFVSYPCDESSELPPQLYPRPQLLSAKTSISFRPTLLTRTTSSPALPRQGPLKSTRTVLNAHPPFTRSNSFRFKGRVKFLLGNGNPRDDVVEIWNTTREEDSFIRC